MRGEESPHVSDGRQRQMRFFAAPMARLRMTFEIAVNIVVSNFLFLHCA
jgi:hypothetical protein